MKNIVIDYFREFPKHELTSVSEIKREAKKELLMEARRLKCGVVLDFCIKEVGSTHKLWFASGIGVRAVLEE